MNNSSLEKPPKVHLRGLLHPNSPANYWLYIMPLKDENCKLPQRLWDMYLEIPPPSGTPSINKGVTRPKGGLTESHRTHYRLRTRPVGTDWSYLQIVNIV